jgi:methyl-accepting chemotaxis protein
MTSLFFKRRRLLVDRFQYRLIWVSVIHFGLVLTVFLVSMMLPLMLKLDDPSATYLEKQRVAEVLLFFNEQLWLPLGAVFLLLTVHSLMVSHRIAGPLYRFQRVFESVAKGDLAVRANIRKHDYLHAHAKSLNEMIEALERRMQGLENQAMQVKEEAAQLKQAARSGAAAEVQKAVERIESQVEGLRGQLAGVVNKS